ncbi:MAG: peptide chain release factor N(5)-glutamine methyltransferase [Bacteroidia bacterium]|nr:peptide chain release factor N(5)-glutamine methyltransferase [Bacteroidia bacterium]MDW8089234.1 peptide chain release factor N(5)-glutamine methyltransferase [Bacteroidia bacterium]
MGSQPLSLAELRQQALAWLTPIYPLAEAQALVRRLLRHFLPDWEQRWLTSGGKAPFPLSLYASWQRALQRLQNREPLAYILGQVEFAGLRLCLRPGVFIPRPETEEWALWTVKRLAPAPPQTILDIGTGSGALALLFARAFPAAQVYAVDRSPFACQTARANARRLGLNLHLACLTFGQSPLPSSWPLRWDLILANPPYIPWTYWEATDLAVRAYEPPEALFCHDTTLYKGIAEFAATHLTSTGAGVVELFPPLAQEVKALFEASGLLTELHCDFSGRPRWLWFQRNEKQALIQSSPPNSLGEAIENKPNKLTSLPSA